MRLSKKAVEEFKKIYFKHYKVRLSDEEANEKGLKILQLFKTITKPLPQK